MTLKMNLGNNSYDILIEHNAILHAETELNLNRRVLIVTDSGVPPLYSQTIAKKCRQPQIYTFPQGEQSKNFETYQKILKAMLEKGFDRHDCVVAVGGGVCGDMAGFAAATYMRGIDFYNIPTTVLSQIDSSIGGKTAIDFMGCKNIIGAFYQPKKVLIDPQTLNTLPERQVSNGLSEAIKMAMTFDKNLFEFFENEDIMNNIDLITERALNIKKTVVECDEKEHGLRRVLNFGHTVGHAIESESGLSGLYHGECVALGMTLMCSDEARRRLKNVLKKVNLPTSYNYNAKALTELIKHDKKCDGEAVNIITVEKIGSYMQKAVTFEQLEKMITEGASR